MLTKEELVEKASNISMGDLHKGKIPTECPDCTSDVEYDIKDKHNVRCKCTECSYEDNISNIRIVT